jgi:hypothetical protein
MPLKFAAEIALCMVIDVGVVFVADTADYMAFRSCKFNSNELLPDCISRVYFQNAGLLRRYFFLEMILAVFAKKA